ncbi:hypothetical protein MTO96_032622 [Rhipicephalus appendiculatus]
MSHRVDSERRATTDAVSTSCRLRPGHLTTSVASHLRRNILHRKVQCRFDSIRLVHGRWRGGQLGDELCARGE